MWEDLWNESGVKRPLWNGGVGLPVKAVITVQRHLNTDLKKLFLLSGRTHSKIQARNGLVCHKPQCKNNNNSLPAEQSVWYKSLYGAHLWGESARLGMKQQTTPKTLHSSTADSAGRETRRMGLDWEKESACQAARHISIDVDKEVGVSGDVCEWVGHVTQQTCLPECAKQFSTWVSTVKPQDPNQLLSHQRLKPCSYPSISEMLC